MIQPAILQEDAVRAGSAASLQVLQLISSAGHYGAETVVLNLSNGLTKMGVGNAVGVFHNTHRPNLEIANAAGRCGQKIEIIPCSGRVDWNAVQALREIIARRKIDIVHTHGYKAHAYALLAVRPPRLVRLSATEPLSCALIATCHGHHAQAEKGSARLRQHVYATAETAVLRRFDQVIAVSASLCSDLRMAGVSADKLGVISNGIDFSEFGSAAPSSDLQQAKRGRVAIGLIGRLVEGKGHSQLFLAMKALSADHPNTVALVVGDGPLRRKLEEQVHELGLASHVIFTGKRKDMPEVYAALDICVLPSLQEGLPMSILESLAAKRAVIATRVGSIPEVIRHEKTGLLIEASDADALHAAIARLLRDATLRQSLATSGAQAVRQQFSAANMTDHYLSLYRKALRVC